MNKCNLCDCEMSRPIYIPQGSLRDAKVFFCTNCGLIQSVVGKSNTLRTKTLSSNANWGNVRHAKPLRLDATKHLIQKEIENLPNDVKILDVGSSRSHFLRMAYAINPRFDLIGIEPDSEVIESSHQFQILNTTIEKFVELEKFFNYRFDFIFMNHTLEHVDDASKVLGILANRLSPLGKIWIDVPNTLLIQDPNIIEEYFIDKHNYHFSPHTLESILQKNGLEIEENFSDQYNLVVKAGISAKAQLKLEANNESQVLEEIFNIYRFNLTNNRNKLRTVAERINSIYNGRTVIFGAGRILDSLIKYGDLNFEAFVIVDSYLYKYAENLSIKIIDPSDVIWAEIDNAVVLAKSSKDQIANFIWAQNEKIQLQFFDDLFR